MDTANPRIHESRQALGVPIWLTLCVTTIGVAVRVSARPWCMSSLRATKLLILMLPALLACVGKDNRTRVSSASVDTSRVSLEVQRATPQLHIEEDLRLDAERENLAPIGVAVVRTDSVIAFTQGFDAQVRLYSHNGVLLAKVGGRGEGPGEFRGSLGALGILGDSLWISDHAKGRETIRIISPDGKLVEKIRTTLVMPSIRDLGRYPFSPDVKVLALLPGGLMLGAVHGGVLAPKGYISAGVPILRMSRRGLIHRTIARFPVDTNYVRMPGSDGKGGCMISVPFAEDHYWPYLASDGNRLVLITTDLASSNDAVLRLTSITAAGDTLFSRRYDIAGVPIPAQRADSALNEMVREIRDSDEGGCAEGGADARRYEREARGRIPALYQPVNRVTVGRDGTTWVALRRNGDKRTYMVLNESGIPVGQLALNADDVLFAAERGRIWTIQHDANDLARIVRYKVSGW